ncbi:HesA/MoeB/ThiF family protein [Brachybacterium squillarum]|uniref:HesA/MoeB/ThiF family protein n=1 Tax=Brachybacterium squillarum TaxID=661979 RepID=UPI00026296A5|nr:ThiF family adenylyltransferase [Brachybacterium squillarum]
METYDDGAFDRFCSGLVNAGFSPVRDTAQARWTGPLRESLQPFSGASRMQISFYPGWPLRYAHITVPGLKAEHANQGTICLWAEDDPAQIAGRDLQTFWQRVDEWAQAAQLGFRLEDRALDAYAYFDTTTRFDAELPFGDLVRAGGNGYRAPLIATTRGDRTVVIERPPTTDPEPDEPAPLRGAFYLRRHIDAPPRDFADFRAALTYKQTRDLDRGLAARTDTALAEPSGGYDFAVLAWPRYDRDHDAVVVAFNGAGDELKASAISATPNDIAARRRRAGPDATALTDKRILIAGAGSVGGHVALSLAASGVGLIRLHDGDHLKTTNLVRHASDKFGVGYNKAIAMAVAIGEHAPWTNVEPKTDNLPYNPSGLTSTIEGFDLIIDCTGTLPFTAALAEICRRTSAPLITGALFHQGAIARVQRQADGDTPIASRPSDPTYSNLPPEDPRESNVGFLELGCTAPVNNAPPTAVLATASDVALAAVDLLTGRCNRADERIMVFQPMAAPFDATGTHDHSPGGIG